MKIAYFDCFSGASGNMILGALIDAGLDENLLKLELSKLNISGYQLLTQQTEKIHIAGIYVDVVLEAEQPERHLADIVEIIQTSSLSKSTKEKSIAIFNRLAIAEAKVHLTTPDRIHFHEVGGVDAIVDIVGSVIGLEKLGIEQVYVSAFPAGHGFVKCAHGRLPLPAPATLELLQGFPIIKYPVAGEFVTPTGAAILTTLGQKVNQLPTFDLVKIGYGAGTKDFPIPNLLRMMIGDLEQTEEMQLEFLSLLETNLDDLNPEIYTHLFKLFFEAGALDVYLTPVIMKKNRPGNIFSVLCRPEDSLKMKSLIFTETTTFGLRERMIQRWALHREFKKVSTKWGDVRIKLAKLRGKIIQSAPEFQDCQTIAEKNEVPVKEVYKQAMAAYIQSVEKV
ncbi:nickel pincer cofactor biosynthesis protein LarC [candidate division KSB1 bacterium]|nr:nickel pincer cofactor biosynthesis protein LarC [candidate division KSB1 bacterium]